MTEIALCFFTFLFFLAAGLEGLRRYERRASNRSQD